MKTLLTLAVILAAVTIAAAPAPVRLTWTAPGDDGNVGRVSGYDIRVTTDTLRPWDDWPVVDVNACVVQCDSASQTVTIDFSVDMALDVGYYFALRAFDDRMNYSARSNITSRIVEDDVPPDPIRDLR
jgi:hypothetical protein